MFKVGWYELENGKNVNLHDLYVFSEKSLDLDSKNEL
jgi:hypothetical protein